MTLGKGTMLYRIHHESYDPSKFSKKGHRFDDPDEASDSFFANYFSLDPLGSYLEVFGRSKSLTREYLDQFQLTAFVLTSDLVAVELDHPLNLGECGINSSFYSCRDYEQSQKLAKRLFRERQRAINYPLRFSLSLLIRGIALLSTSVRLPRLLVPRRPMRISPELQDEGYTKCGVQISP